MDCRAHFDTSLVQCKTLKEAIQTFNEKFSLDDACEYCGHILPSDGVAGSCKLCKTVNYCSKNCQTLDWYNGHKAECEAILSEKPIQSLCEDSKTFLIDRNTVIGRHLGRFEDVTMKEYTNATSPDDIGRGFGRGGGGGGGRGFGPRGGGGGRWGGGGWGRWGRGVLSTALFGPPVYGRGGLPWFAYNGYYVPWWYNLPSYYYEQGLTYGSYGVPPYRPGKWGNVPPPPSGPGYASVPQ